MSSVQSRTSLTALKNNYVFQVVLVALSYMAACQAGELLAIPPSIVSPVWPAAGVALAALLVAGMRVWPGLIIGHLLFNILSKNFPGTPVELLLDALPYAPGPVLTAIFGAFFARRTHKGLAPGRDRNVFFVMLMAGPVACLIGASWATGLLVSQGYVDSGDAFSTWFLWWIGDSLGVLLFAPLALLLLPAGRRRWPGRTWQVALPLLGACIILIPSVYWFHISEEKTARDSVDAQAALAFDLARERINAVNNAIESTANYVSTSQAVTEDQFRSFTQRVMTSGIIALGWIPRVSDEQRAAFEVAAQQSGLENYRLLQNDGNGGLEAASPRSEYYPLLFVNTAERRMPPAGFDFGRDPERLKAIISARDSGRSAADAAVARSASDRPFSGVLYPVYRYGTNAATMTIEQRREALLGFVGGAVVPQVVLGSLATDAGNEILRFRIEDVAAGEPAQLLQDVDSSENRGSTILWSRDLEFHGRTWRVDADVNSLYWQAGRSAKSRIFLLLTLLGAFLIAVQSLAAAARDRIVSLRVAARARELNENRRRLRGALHVAKIACWELDVATGILTLDDRAFKILGTTAAQEGGYRLSVSDWIGQFVHPEDAASIRAALYEASVAKPAADQLPNEFRVHDRNGETRHLLMYFDADTDAEGGVIVVYGNTLDITHRKTAELALHESVAYSRSIVESSSDCIMVLGLEGQLLDINNQGLALLDLGDIDRVRGTDWRAFWKNDADHDAARKAVAEAAAGGTARFTGFTPPIRGIARWWDVVITPIAGADNNPQSLLCVSRDISEEHTAKEEVRRINESLGEEVQRRSLALSSSERELRAIFEVAAIGIAHISLDDRVLRVNPKMCEITGYDEATFLQQHDVARTHVADRKREQELIADLVNGTIATYTMEKRYLRRDDTTIWLRVTGSLVRNEQDEPLYRVSIVEDISTARAEAELRTASERRYRELFDRNPTPMWTYDSESLAFTSVNDAAIAHYGYSREEFLHMTLRDLRVHEMQAELDDLLQQRKPGFTPAHTTTHIKKDGTPITVEITAHGIVNDGRPARLVVANDVSEKVLAATLLEGQKNVLEQIAFGAPLETSLNSLARLAEKSSRGVRCMVLLANSADGTLESFAAPSLEKTFISEVNNAARESRGFFSEIAHCTDAIVVTDLANDLRWPALAALASEHSVQACWSNPILDAESNILGAFVLFYGDARKPRQLEGDLVDTLTNTAAIAVTKDRETRRLRESEERFRSTFETAALGMLHVDTRGRFTRANPSVCKIIGYSKEELIGMNPDELSHPDDLEIGQAERQRMFAGEIPSYSVEKRYIHKDGSTVWLNVTISTVSGKNGAIEYAIALLEDISWRKQAEAELHRQQEINRLLLENLTEGVVACDADGHLMLFNKAAREWHGADPREISPEEWSNYYNLYDADGETLLDTDSIPLMRAFRGERVKAVEMSIVRKGHPPRTVLASGAPLLDADGTKRGAVVVMHDVTLRRQSLQKLERSAEELREANATVENERASLARRVAERTLELTAANSQLATAKEAAESASRAKSAFLAVMSHEIRTPMNGILGMVDILSQSALGEDQQDAVLTIRESSFSLLRLIDDILDFSKVEAGRLELENTTISLPEIVEGVCDSLTPDALANEVDLKLFIDPRVPEQVVSDPMRLRQLLFNLIGNAVKFSGGRPAVRGCVKVHVQQEATTPLTVAFRIVDNGVGIAPEALPRLFDSFTQAEVSTTRRFGGTGLGLAITKRLIELMHGRIEVVSELGTGSEFIVRLPLARALSEAPKIEFDLQGVNCVLIKDADNDCDALQAYLEDVDVATQLAEDLDAAQRLTANNELSNVVIRRLDGETPTDESLLASHSQNTDQVNLIITRGPRSHARVVRPHIVVLQASAIRRHDFLHAVAIAAGRASPEVLRSPVTELVRGQLVAPTVAQARTDGRLILVAEDDAINQKVILRQLALLGYAGEMASNGAEALRMWRDGSYALLLTDLHMPEMDGYELTRCIRAEESAEIHLPVIALTANALRGEAERAATAGFDAYLTKPLQLSVLSATLDEWVPAVRGEQQHSYMQAAGAASDSSPAIDIDVLRSIIGNDEALMREFLGDYLEASMDNVAELQDSVKAGDARLIAEHAHRQKGAARAIGASKLGDVCAELENAGRADDHGQISHIATQYALEVAEVNAEIQAILLRARSASTQKVVAPGRAERNAS